MNKLFISLLMATIATVSFPVLAGDAAAGKAKSAVCAACHGMKGISAADIWPNLAGQKKGYLIKQMKAFRDGTRSEPTMDAMMKPLSDEDIENLAAYYNSLSGAP